MPQKPVMDRRTPTSRCTSRLWSRGRYADHRPVPEPPERGVDGVDPGGRNRAARAKTATIAAVMTIPSA